MSVYIVKRPTAKPRVYSWHVRWKRGRYDPIVHLGTFPMERLARLRKQKAEEIVAAGGIPTREVLDSRGADSLASLAERYMASRVDAAPKTRESLQVSIDLITHRWGSLPPAAITPEDVVEWITELQTKGPDAPRRDHKRPRPLKPGTIKLRVLALRQVLDYGVVAPNPTRDPRVKLPRQTNGRRRLPSSSVLAGVRASLSEERRQLFDVLEHGGLRIEEACSLTWGQVDQRRGRLVDVGTKTGAPRTVERLDGQPDWVPARPAGAEPDAAVFPGTTPREMRGALTHRSEKTGVKVTPHTLRHLHASRLLDGMNRDHHLGIADMAARMGHSIATFTRTYTHVLPPAEDVDCD